MNHPEVMWALLVLMFHVVGVSCGGNFLCTAEDPVGVLLQNASGVGTFAVESGCPLGLTIIPIFGEGDGRCGQGFWRACYGEVYDVVVSSRKLLHVGEFYVVAGGEDGVQDVSCVVGGAGD
ncbi:hypothetical protein NDU88_004325 [Pleurodeles waltl]|uniref:Uncharacterized protein n=1 Tax=Pleurodeles waltl TaxID=8319 RepID=A0AAV7SIG8_PLEWA|nr:hypothetical protein NDU88_004325 [Pleurodeles waltl]